MIAVLALISTERLQIVNLPSMSRESMVGPVYSATRFEAPPSPIIPRTWRTRSFA